MTIYQGVTMIFLMMQCAMKFHLLSTALTTDTTIMCEAQ